MLSTVVSLLPLALVALLVVALILQPIAQRRREDAISEQMKEARNALEAQAMADTAMEAHQPKSKLPMKWYDSYRFWLK